MSVARLAALYAPYADTSRSEFPGPEPVAAACHEAQFDAADERLRT